MSEASGPESHARPAFAFSDAAALAILQARHEALHLGTPMVTPAHLALGVLKTVPRTLRGELCPGATAFADLCRELGGAPAAAAVIAADVEYTDAAREALAGARAAAAADLGASMIEPLHILLGILAPGGLPAAADTIAALARAGLRPAELLAHLARRRAAAAG